MSKIRHRLFFALQPPPRQRALMGVCRDAIPGVRTVVSNERLHVTLAITDDFECFPREVEREMLELGTEVAADPFAMLFDRLSGSSSSVALRPGRRIPGLSSLYVELDRGMTRRRLRRSGWRFSPHATLAYRDGSPFQQAVPPIQWEVGEFALVHSVVGETRHIELGRWQLAFRQGRFPF